MNMNAMDPITGFPNTATNNGGFTFTPDKVASSAQTGGFTYTGDGESLVKGSNTKPGGMDMSKITPTKANSIDPRMKTLADQARSSAFENATKPGRFDGVGRLLGRVAENPTVKTLGSKAAGAVSSLSNSPVAKVLGSRAMGVGGLLAYSSDVGEGSDKVPTSGVDFLGNKLPDGLGAPKNQVVSKDPEIVKKTLEQNTTTKPQDTGAPGRLAFSPMNDAKPTGVSVQDLVALAHAKPNSPETTMSVIELAKKLKSGEGPGSLVPKDTVRNPNTGASTGVSYADIGAEGTHIPGQIGAYDKSTGGLLASSEQRGGRPPVDPETAAVNRLIEIVNNRGSGSLTASEKLLEHYRGKAQAQDSRTAASEQAIDNRAKGYSSLMSSINGLLSEDQRKEGLGFKIASAIANTGKFDEDVLVRNPQVIAQLTDMFISQRNAARYANEVHLDPRTWPNLVKTPMNENLLNVNLPIWNGGYDPAYVAAYWKDAKGTGASNGTN